MRSQLAAALHLQPLWKSEGRGQWWSHGGEPAEGGGLPPQLEPDPGLRRGAHRSRRPFHGGRRRDRLGGGAGVLPPRTRQGRGGHRAVERNWRQGRPQTKPGRARDQGPPPPHLQQHGPARAVLRRDRVLHRRQQESHGQGPLQHPLQGHRRHLVRRRGSDQGGRHAWRVERDVRGPARRRSLCFGWNLQGTAGGHWGGVGAAQDVGGHDAGVGGDQPRKPRGHGGGSQGGRHRLSQATLVTHKL
mmetsp:Transcript_3054/g.8293  ORF Transcript_3054/g.8293 Transcript_3054/m.8293 type:complete len:245 (+) Transcript_3054:2185-2919(+)